MKRLKQKKIRWNTGKAEDAESCDPMKHHVPFKSRKFTSFQWFTDSPGLRVGGSRGDSRSILAVPGAFGFGS